jgi:hypothetical protein
MGALRTVGMAVAIPYGALVALHIAKGFRMKEALTMPVNDVQMAAAHLRQPNEIWRHLNRSNGQNGMDNAMQGIKETASGMKESMAAMADDMRSNASEMADNVRSRASEMADNMKSRASEEADRAKSAMSERTNAEDEQQRPSTGI